MTTAVALGVNPACPRTHLAPRAPRARADPRGRARSSPRRRGRRRRDTSLGHRAEFGAERFVLCRRSSPGGTPRRPQPLPGGRHERTRERLAPPLRRDRAARVRGSAGGAVPRETHHRVRAARRVLFAAAREAAASSTGVGREAVPEGRRDAQRRRRSRSETRVERSRSWWTKTRVSS